MRGVRLWVAVAACVAVGFPVHAPAQVVAYTAEPAFLAAAGPVTREAFDGVPSGTLFGVGTATVSGVTYTSTDPAARWEASSIRKGVSPPNFFGVSNGGQDSRLLTFGLGTAVAGVGLHLLSFTVSPPAVLEVTATAADGAVFTETITLSGDATAYRGFTAPAGITAVTARSLSFLNFGFDNVSVGTPVPEPTGLALTAAALGGWLARGRVRRGQLRPGHCPLRSSS